MKVLHLTHYARGGIVTVVFTQITQRATANIEYHVAVVEDSDELRALARERGVHLHVLGKDAYRMTANYRRLLRELRPQLIHTHSYVPRLLTAAMLSLGQTRALHVSTLHNDYPYFHAGDVRSRLKRATEAFCLRNFCDRIVCGSQQVLMSALQTYRLSAARVRKVHNGIQFEPAPARTAHAGSPPIAVTVGRVSEQKNYGLLLDCWVRVLQQLPQARLWIVGDGEQREVLERRAREQGIAQSVQFLGWKAPREIPAILAQADVFVLSSLHESLPTAMLESFAAGLPVISTRVAGADEVIEQGLSGYVVDDANGLTQALVKMLALDSAERAAMGERGRRRVLAEFSAERFARQVEGVYLEAEGNVASARILEN